MNLTSVIRYSTPATLLVLSVSLYADTQDNAKNRIDNACLRQAVSLVNQLKSEIYTDMDSTQSNKIVKLATATCRQQFSKIEAEQAVATIEPAKEKQAEEESDGSIFDIFTKKVERKPGNERLRKHKH